MDWVGRNGNARIIPAHTRKVTLAIRGMDGMISTVKAHFPQIGKLRCCYYRI